MRTKLNERKVEGLNSEVPRNIGMEGIKKKRGGNGTGPGRKLGKKQKRPK